MMWPRLWLGICLLLVALAVWLALEAVSLSLPVVPRLLILAAVLLMTWQAFQSVRGKGKGGQR
jgi:hypothetical protein